MCPPHWLKRAFEMGTKQLVLAAVLIVAFGDTSRKMFASPVLRAPPQTSVQLPNAQFRNAPLGANTAQSNMFVYRQVFTNAQPGWASVCALGVAGTWLVVRSAARPLPSASVRAKRCGGSRPLGPPQAVVSGRSSSGSSHVPPAALLHSVSMPSASRLPRNGAIEARTSQRPSMLESKGGAPKPTAVYLLLLLNFCIFVADRVLRVPLIKTFYLHHARWKWWQPLSACRGERPQAERSC